MSIKTITDPVRGQYDVLVADGNVAAGAILPGSITIVSGVVGAALGATTFLVSGSACATTASLPVITTAQLGNTARIMADAIAITITASNGLASPANAWTAGLAAYGIKEYQAVSGAAGFYWHTVE